MTANGELAWKSTFQPDCRREDFDSMRATFFHQRAELALASIGECEQMNRAAQLPTVGDEIVALLARHSEASFAVFDDPVFTIWLRFLRRAAANGRSEEVKYHAARLPSTLARVERRLSRAEQTYVPGTLIPVQQDDLDPYVMAATPPTYDFLAAAEAQHAASPEGHPVPLQADLLGIALDAIGNTWPEMKEQVLDFVKIIGYLPRVSFRSCSAGRYSGVVYFGNMDESILDLEESIVHETGHQVLYRLAEVTPLTRPGTPQEATFDLPWSGSKRDFFGYLHAFYIYVLLIKYFWRRGQAGRYNAEDSRRRAELILLGCMLARPTLESHPYLTEQGRVVMNELCTDIDELRRVMGVPGRAESKERVANDGTQAHDGAAKADAGRREPAAPDHAAPAPPGQREPVDPRHGEFTDLRFADGIRVAMDGGKIIIRNMATGCSKTFARETEPILDQFMDWTSMDTLVQRTFEQKGGEAAQNDVVAIVRDLVDLDVLTTRKQELTGARLSAPGAGWTAAMRFLLETRTTRDTVYAVPAEFYEALAQKAALYRQPSAFYERVDCPFHALSPPPALEHAPAGSFAHVMLERRTARRFADRQISEAQLSMLLHFSWGMTHAVANPLGDFFLRKTSPSGGSLHPIEVYPIVFRVEGMAPGCYHYSVRRHGLEELSREDPSKWIVEACGDQAWVAEAAVIFLCTAFLPRTAWKYDFSRVARAVISEVGYSGQSAFLTATWLGLGAFTTAALRDEIFEDVLGLDPTREPVFSVTGAGHLEPEIADHARPRFESAPGVEST